MRQRQSLKASKPTGKLVSILHNGEGRSPAINFQYLFVKPKSTQLEHLRELTEAGQLQAHVSHTFTLDQKAEALSQIQAKHTTSKMVIVP